ncbi:hypothetical protein ACFL2A_02550, partial [Thermodesulfobacteriota bacterium]
MKNVLLIFAKEPVAGMVKTRLGKDVGDDLARDIYEAFLKDITANVMSSDLYETVIYCTPESNGDNLKKLLNIDTTVIKVWFAPIPSPIA